MGVATAFHQIVDERRPHEGAASCNHLREEFHETLAFLDAMSKTSAEMWITFDDGYRTAAEIVDEIAPRFPTLKFVFFVCPEKIAEQVGFRWDAWERLHSSDAPVVPFEEFHGQPATPNENRREDLRAAASDERFRLATVEQCVALLRHPNVRLGNHSNRHVALTSLTPAEAAEEIRASHEQFRKLFNETEHFAFPYGTPGVSYNDEHVAALRTHGYRYIWSTEGSGFRQGSQDRAVLPRIPMNGLATVEETKGTLVKYLVKARVRQLRESKRAW